VQNWFDLAQNFLPTSRAMRLLVEIVIIAGLIYLGWEKPFKEWQNQVRAAVTSKQPAPVPEQARETPVPQTTNPFPQARPNIPAPPQHGAWRLDPNYHGALDRPSPSPTIQP
jgi:hypothetical protein